MDMDDDSDANSGTTFPSAHQQDDQSMDTILMRSQEAMTQMEDIFHQDKTPLIQRAGKGNLWQLPNPVAQGVKPNAEHPITKLFYKNSNLIHTNWHIDLHDILPEEMRTHTPYSLALYTALRHLSSHSKKHPEVGREALFFVWRGRVEERPPLTFDGSDAQFWETRVEDHLPGPANCELSIQEFNYGVTLQDLRSAIKVANGLMKGHQAQLPQPSGKLRGGASNVRRADVKIAKKAVKKEKKALRESGLSNRAMQDIPNKAADSKITKRNERERRKVSRMQEKMQGEKGFKVLRFMEGGEDDDDGGVTLTGLEYGTMGDDADDADDASTAPPNSPKSNDAMYSETCDRAIRRAEREKSRAEILAAASDPNQPVHYHNKTWINPGQAKKKKKKKAKTPGDAPKLPPPKTTGKGPDDEGYTVPVTRHDRHNDRVLSAMFNRVDMDSTKELKKKKAEKLVAGANRHDTSMPTDRIRFAEMPSLYGTKIQGEAADAFEKMMLGGAVRSDPVAEGNGAVSGNGMVTAAAAEEKKEQGGVSLINGGEDEEL